MREYLKILVITLVVLVLGFVVFNYFDISFLSRQKSPQDTTLSFFTKWKGASEDNLQTAGKIEAVKDIVVPDFVRVLDIKLENSEAGFDPILCSADKSPDYSLVKTSEDGDQVEVIMDVMPGAYVKVFLVRVLGETWKIADVQCISSQEI